MCRTRQDVSARERTNPLRRRPGWPGWPLAVARILHLCVISNRSGVPSWGARGVRAAAFSPLRLDISPDVAPANVATEQIPLLHNTRTEYSGLRDCIPQYHGRAAHSVFWIQRLPRIFPTSMITVCSASQAKPSRAGSVLAARPGRFHRRKVGGALKNWTPAAMEGATDQAAAAEWMRLQPSQANTPSKSAVGGGRFRGCDCVYWMLQ